MIKELNTRIQNKFDTKDNWDVCDKLSLKGELYVHQLEDETRLTIGDGIRLIKDLPYVGVSSKPEDSIVRISKPYLKTDQFVYNGLFPELEWINYNPNYMTLTMLSQHYEVGTYAARFTLFEGYIWEDGTDTPYDVSWNIIKANWNISASSTNVALNESTRETVITLSYGWSLGTTIPTIEQITSTGETGVTFVNTEWVNSNNQYNQLKLIGISGQTFENYIVRIKLPETNTLNAGYIDITVSSNIPAKSLDDYTWDEIAEIAASGNASNVFSIGDFKKIKIAELATADNPVHIGPVRAYSNSVNPEPLHPLTLNYPADTCVYIIGFNHNYDKEKGSLTNYIDFGMFYWGDSALPNDGHVDYDEVIPMLSWPTALVDISYLNIEYSSNDLFCMNTSNYDHSDSTADNTWGSCTMRSEILGSTDQHNNYPTTNCATNPTENTLMAALPNDLRKVMKPISKNGNPNFDYLPLFSVIEVFGKHNPSDNMDGGTENMIGYNTDEIYEFYALGNKKARRAWNGQSIHPVTDWWLRTPDTETTEVNPDYYEKRFFKCRHNSTYNKEEYGVSAQEFNGGVAPLFRV